MDYQKCFWCRQRFVEGEGRTISDNRPFHTDKVLGSQSCLEDWAEYLKTIRREGEKELSR